YRPLWAFRRSKPMKRILFLIGISLIPILTSLGQSNLKQDKKHLPKGLDQFTVYTYGNGAGDARTIGYINQGDTLFSAVYRTYPYLWLTATVEDTAASDTVSLEFQLWQGATTDTTDMLFVKTLSWNLQDGSVTASDSITAAGIWWSNVGTTAFTGLPYFTVKAIGKVTNKILNGVQATLEAWGENR
ncbi:hypothetical protein BVY01_00780, partial [bacterium I07]